MTKFNCRHSIPQLLLATALPLILLASAMPAHAGSVTVTGANGAAGAPGQPGGAGGSATATSTSSDPSNSATATGGDGGNGGSGSVVYPPFYPPGAGGAGGGASSTATATSTNGSASATATSSGGNGGRGGLPNACLHSCIPGDGGAGGPASSTAAAASTTGSATATASSTGGSRGGGSGYARPGAASAAASANSSGSSAGASANARNSYGTALAAAYAPGASSASALTKAAVGSGAESLVPITGGQAISNAVLTPGAGDIGVGAMSAGYGGSDQALQYKTTAAFDFTTSTSEELYLNLLSDEVSGTGFDSLKLKVVVDGTTYAYKLRLARAERFFTSDSLDLGQLAVGSQSIELDYFLDYNSGTLAAAGDGFGFAYDFATAPLAAAPSGASFDFTAPAPTGGVPEPSTWAMLLIGFAGVGLAQFFRPCRSVADAG